MNKAKGKIDLIWDWDGRGKKVPESISLPLSTLAGYIEGALVSTNLSTDEIVKPVYSLHYKLGECGALRDEGFVKIPTELANEAFVEYVRKIGSPSGDVLYVEFPTKVIIESLASELDSYKNDLPEEKRMFEKLLRTLNEALEIL